MSEIKILKTNCDWMEIKNDCRHTVNKEGTDVAPSTEFIQKLLISEHSPIREANIKWVWKGIKSWVSVHFARHHVGWEKYVSTQRTDRTGINRDELPQGALVNMEVTANPQSLINVSRVRLCNQAAAETRQAMENLKYVLKPMQPEISNVMVPNCVYRAGCPEMNPCNFFNRFKDYAKSKGVDHLSDISIAERYEIYNAWFYENYSHENAEG